MKYSVGDRVRIVSEKVGHHWNEAGMMDKWLGKIMTIREVGSTSYKMEEDCAERLGIGWYWHPEMIAHKIEEEISMELKEIFEKISNAIEDGNQELAKELFAKAKEIDEILTEDRFVICADCKKLVDADETYRYYGDRICEDCFEESYSTCHDCGKIFRNEDMTWIEHYDRMVCEDCLDGNYVTCDRCGEITHRYDTYRVRTQSGFEDWCEYCRENYATYCEECDSLYSDDDYCDCPCQSGIHSYGYKPDPRFFGESEDNLFMGIELEVDDGESPNNTAERITDVGCGHVYCKHDGSLDDGIEIVSHPCTLDYHRNNLPWKSIMKTALNSGFRSHDTNTCGMHVHVSRDFFGNTEEEQDLVIAKLMLIVNRFWNSNIIPFTRRKAEHLDHWAKKNCSLDDCHTKETVKSLADKCKKSRGDRYQAININNDNTVEFRIFRGTLKWETFIATLEWVDSVCRAAKKYKLRDIPIMPWEDTLPEKCSDELYNYLEELATKFDKALAINPIQSYKGDNHVYQVNEKVTVLSYRTLCERYEKFGDILLTNGAMFVPEMKEYCGHTYTISEIIDEGFMLKGIDDYVFTASMVRKPRPNVNPNKIELDV